MKSTVSLQTDVHKWYNMTKQIDLMARLLLQAIMKKNSNKWFSTKRQQHIKFIKVQFIETDTMLLCMYSIDLVRSHLCIFSNNMRFSTIPPLTV